MFFEDLTVFAGVELPEVFRPRVFDCVADRLGAALLGFRGRPLYIPQVTPLDGCKASGLARRTSFAGRRQQPVLQGAESAFSFRAHLLRPVRPTAVLALAGRHAAGNCRRRRAARTGGRRVELSE